jgi:hypothetical protein
MAKKQITIKAILDMAGITVADIVKAHHAPGHHTLFVAFKDGKLTGAKFKALGNDRRLYDSEYVFAGVAYADELITVGSWKDKCTCFACGGKTMHTTMNELIATEDMKDKLKDWGFEVV